jgi:hypothetical protein
MRDAVCFSPLTLPLFNSAIAHAALALMRDPRVERVLGRYHQQCRMAATFWLAPAEILAPRSVAVVSSQP